MVVVVEDGADVIFFGDIVFSVLDDELTRDLPETASDDSFDAILFNLGVVVFLIYIETHIFISIFATPLKSCFLFFAKQECPILGDCFPTL